MNAPQTVHLVACCSKKLSTPAPARELYCSPLFLKTRAVVEATGQPWFILSARHGLVEPTQVLEPYNWSLKDSGKRLREAWGSRAMSSLNHKMGRSVRLVLWAGHDYRDALHWGIRHHLCWSIEQVVPLKGLGIGQQLQRLDQILAGEVAL